MRSFILFHYVVLIALSTIIPSSLLAAQNVTDAIAVAESLTYVRIYADSDGVVRFATGGATQPVFDQEGRSTNLPRESRSSLFFDAGREPTVRDRDPRSAMDRNET